MPQNSSNYFALPADLPIPTDDGACDHLTGMTIPSVWLQSTAGRSVDLSAETGLIVAYFYPMTGTPGVPLPAGWDLIPGARGCTPQSCGFRDVADDFAARGATIYGISTQSPADQSEAATRLHLPFELLSDEQLRLSNALRLPLFDAGGRMRIHRLTLILDRGRITKVFYPIFPSDTHAKIILAWMNQSPLR